MLATAAIVEAVAACVESLDLPNLVVDPVMVAKGGDRLLDDDAVRTVRSALLRLALVVTPNVPEAEALSGVSIRSLGDMREAARRILQLGPRAVIVKGGHLAGDTSPDLLISTAGELLLEGPRLAVASTHGTGCTFASAIAARLAVGDTLEQAARSAKDYVAGAMRNGIAVGAGHQPLDHFWQTR
jgi:hydroxymethylpyrimidine/phosphomethylpyrimidine kinase